jgi:hypothetical protein
MVDTQRFQLGPGPVDAVADVVLELASRHDGETNALQVATYLPLDIESVSRILDSLAEDYDLERVEHNGLSVTRINLPDERTPVDIDAGEHLEDATQLMDNLTELKAEQDWDRKVRDQHAMLQLAGDADNPTIDLSHFTGRADIPSAKIQSILNDFGAEGYVECRFDEESDTLSYRFPPLSYPRARMERNLAILDDLDDSGFSRRRIQVGVAVAFLLLIGILILQFAL